MDKAARTAKSHIPSRNVWLFRNIRTNQVIISLRWVIQSKSYLRQFNFPQKGMFPVSLRRDHWVPLVHAQFPVHALARDVYNRLVTLRQWRLTSPTEPDTALPRKKDRNREGLNMVPTSVADLAHVTSRVKAKMNWARGEERLWAREWGANVAHYGGGFDLDRGRKLGRYEFPGEGDRIGEQVEPGRGEFGGRVLPQQRPLEKVEGQSEVKDGDASLGDFITVKKTA
jgi:Transcriptional regulation of mitochondrial recombination